MTAIKPLPYGDYLAFYENGHECPERFAALFRRCIVGFDGITPEDVRGMYTDIPRLLEYAVLKASGYLSEDTDDDATEDVPEDSIWAKHNKTKAEQRRRDPEEVHQELMYALRQLNEDYRTVYQLQMPEIQDLLDASERAQEQAKQNSSDRDRDRRATVSTGNRQDRVAQLAGR